MNTEYIVTITRMFKPASQYSPEEKLERVIYSQEFTEYALQPVDLIAHLNKLQPIPDGE